MQAALASDPAGNLIAVSERGGDGLFGRYFRAGGPTPTPAFKPQLGFAFEPSVAADRGGSFVIAWTGTNRVSGGLDIFARRFAGAPASVSIEDVRVVELDVARLARFRLTLSAASPHPIEVRCQTEDGTASANADYIPITDTVVFPAGVTTATVDVPILGDDAPEEDETFSVVLTAAEGATIADDRGVATIVDDDALPVVSIAHNLVVEGDTGRVDLPFTVSLSKPYPFPVWVYFATVDGTARAVLDYAPRFGALRFPPGTTARSLVVRVRGDRLGEPLEYFFAVLGTPVNATLGDSVGVGVIVDDDP
jgi:chitinase